MDEKNVEMTEDVQSDIQMVKAFLSNKRGNYTQAELMKLDELVMVGFAHFIFTAFFAV